MRGTSSTPYSRGSGSAASGVVLHEEHAGEAAGDVRLGLAVRVGVVPERRRLLVDVPLGRPRGIRLDHLVRPAVHLGRQVHAVPVHGGRHVERVGDVDPHVLAALRDEGRAEVGAVEAPRVARHTGCELGGPGLGVQAEDPRAVGVDDRRCERRDGEGRLEVDLADRRHRGGPDEAAPGERHRDEGTGGERGEGADCGAGSADPEGVRTCCWHGSSLAIASGAPQPVCARIGSGVFPRPSARAVREASGDEGRRHRHPAQVVDGCRERIELDDGEIRRSRRPAPTRHDRRWRRPAPRRPRSPARDATAPARRACVRRPPRSRPTGRAAPRAHRNRGRAPRPPRRARRA